MSFTFTTSCRSRGSRGDDRHSNRQSIYMCWCTHQTLVRKKTYLGEVCSRLAFLSVVRVNPPLPLLIYPWARPQPLEESSAMIMKTGFVAWLCREANYSPFFFFFFGNVLLEIFFALLQNIFIASASQLILYLLTLKYKVSSNACFFLVFLGFFLLMCSIITVFWCNFGVGHGKFS